MLLYFQEHFKDILLIWVNKLLSQRGLFNVNVWSLFYLCGSGFCSNERSPWNPNLCVLSFLTFTLLAHKQTPSSLCSLLSLPPFRSGFRSTSLSNQRLTLPAHPVVPSAHNKGTPTHKASPPAPSKVKPYRGARCQRTPMGTSPPQRRRVESC